MKRYFYSLGAVLLLGAGVPAWRGYYYGRARICRCTFMSTAATA